MEQKVVTRAKGTPFYRTLYHTQSILNMEDE